MAVTASRMSLARRLLVLLAFALMIGGVVLMVAQREELFLAASVGGFVLVLSAVPGRAGPRRGAAEPPDGPAGANAATPAAPDAHPAAAQHDNGARGHDAAALGPREWTGNVTVLPRPAGDTSPIAKRSQQVESRHEEAAPAVEEAAPADEHVERPVEGGAPGQGGAPGPVGRAGPSPRPPAAAVAAPPARTPERSGSSPALSQAPAGAEVSPRRVAAVGAAAGALVWLVRRVRR